MLRTSIPARPSRFAGASLRRMGRSLLMLPLLGALSQAPALAAEAPTPVPPPAVDAPMPAGGGLQKVVLAGGCFWGVQAVYQHVKGVSQAVSGYAGGSAASADYETVSSGGTGHAESVQITFDPRVVSYGRILQVYFSVAHNPTELNRQGPDTGTQYRSEVFYQDDTQKRVAEAYIAQLDKAGTFGRPIVTRLDPLVAFYPAEDYHQNYAINHPNSAYIAYNDLPKVENLKRLFPDLWREAPAMVALGSPSQ